MNDNELLELMKSIDPQSVRVPPGVRKIVEAVIFIEREAWRNEIEPYLVAASDSSMSRNNSEQLADELLEWIKKRSNVK